MSRTANMVDQLIHSSFVHAGPLEARLSLPAAGTGPGVILLHAWWGLNPFFKRLGNRLAGEGFVTLAPDLYQG